MGGPLRRDHGGHHTNFEFKRARLIRVCPTCANIQDKPFDLHIEPAALAEPCPKCGYHFPVMPGDPKTPRNLSRATAVATLVNPKRNGSMRISACIAAATLACAVSAPVSYAQMAQKPTTPADYNFVFQAAYGGWGEVMAGQLAPQRSTNPAVLQAASMMVADHTQANQELASLAAARGITPPTTPDPGRMGAVTILQPMTGLPFDIAYLQEQTADHVMGIALFQSEAQSSLDPEMRAFAEKYLPVLQRHYQTLSALMTSMAAAR
jgi:putative membrane protein